jgi:PII-like signaling protein
MNKIKMQCLTVRIRKNDTVGGKRLHIVLLDLLKKSNVAGATVWTGIGGYGKHGKSDVHIEGITVNMPLIIEIVDAEEKITPILSEIKNLVNGNGILTVHQVESF